MNDEQLAREFVARWRAGVGLTEHDGDTTAALILLLAATRLDERRAIATWIEAQTLSWGRSTVRTAVQQIAMRIKRGEHTQQEAPP